MPKRDSIGSLRNLQVVNVEDLFSKNDCSKMNKMRKSISELQNKIEQKLSDTNLIHLKIETAESKMLYLYVKQIPNFSKEEKKIKKEIQTLTNKKNKNTKTLKELKGKIEKKMDEYELCLAKIRLIEI